MSFILSPALFWLCSEDEWNVTIDIQYIFNQVVGQHGAHPDAHTTGLAPERNWYNTPTTNGAMDARRDEAGGSATPNRRAGSGQGRRVTA
jgi:hypothetical protein